MKQHKRMDTRQRILDLLERRKWPVWRLAQKSGINHSTIFNMIQRKNMPSLKTIEEVTAAFGISMRQFFAEKGDPALLTPQQEAVFFLYHDTSIPQRKAILHAMELLSEQNWITKTNYNENEFQEDHNMDAIARIKELMEERGWTLYRLSQESGIAITTLINLLHHSKQPALQTIEIICESMEITLAEFFTRPSEPGGFTAEQLKLFALWDSLTEEQRSAVLELLLALQAKRNE